MMRPVGERALWIAGELGLERQIYMYARRLVRMASENPEEHQTFRQVLNGWGLVLPLGSDGLSRTYLAEKADGGLDRLVAIKISHSQLAEASKAQKFLDEVRLLAMLYDPGLTRVLDSGILPDGRGYLVTDFTGGIPITEAAKELPTKEKVELFRKVLVVLGYAHERKVLHGDLKPENVLIDMDSSARLLDIGMARAFSAGSDSVAAQEFLSPEALYYASPEQVLGKLVSPATDVYALGLILFETLVGRRPYGDPDDTVMALGRAICEKIPEEVPDLGLDLNYIVQKALAKNSEARYSSVALFLKDIDLYLDGKALVARNVPFYVAIMSAVQKNWLTASMVTAILAISVYALIDRGKSANKDVDLKSIGAILAGGKGGAKKGANEGLSSAESAKKYLDEMLAQNAERPEVMEELAKAYLRLAEVELKGGTILSGNRGAAIQSARKSLDLNLQLMGKDAMTEQKLIEYSKSAKMLSKLLSDARDYQEAIKVVQAWKLKVNQLQSNNPEMLAAQAEANQALADLMEASGQRQAALPVAKTAMQQFGAIFEADKGSETKGRQYAQAANNVGEKSLRLNLLLDSLNAFKVAEAVLRPQAKKPDSEVGPLLDLAKTLDGLGMALEKSNQGDQARASYKEARQLLEQAAKKEADNEEALQALANNLIQTARFHTGLREFGDAAAECERAIQMLRKLSEKPTSSPDFKRQLAQALTIKGELVMAQKSREAAKQLFQEALSLWAAYGQVIGLRPEEEQEMGRVRELSGE